MEGIARVLRPAVIYLAVDLDLAGPESPAK